jgi:outer membrane protein assembly factor BamB
MSALGKKVLDLAEQQGLLDGKAIAELRKQVAESKFVITPQAIAKVLVDHGHLTPFQARKLVSQALGNVPDPFEQRAQEQDRQRKKNEPFEDLTLADDSSDDVSWDESDQEEVVELEAIDLGPLPAKPRSEEKRPKEKPPAALDRAGDASTAEDFVELEPVETPPPRGNRWKTDSPGGALPETIELEPLDLNEPPPPAASPKTPAADLVPIDDLFGPDPFGAPPTPSRPPSHVSPPGYSSPPRHATPPAATDIFAPVAPAPAPLVRTVVRVAKPAKNVWDSPLLLIGGGALGLILVAFFILLYVLTRGSAAEMFAKAEEEYRSGSYTQANDIYDKFLKQYADDPNASLARVRRGMASLRQVTDDGKNPRLGLETARQVLPQIESEEKFGEARGELATILPDIADGFATLASQAADTSRKEELVKLTGEALALVNNPAYLPASLRKERESHIARTIDKIKVAERSIQQDKDLAAAVSQIAAAADKGNAAAAYDVQSNLLRTYPGLATNVQLVASIRQVGEKERQLVTVSREASPPQTQDHPAGSERVIISFREGTPPAAASSQPVFILVEGAVYGIDAAGGGVLWRRFVGYETTTMPVALGDGDVVLIDGRRRELVRLKGTSGELVWRQPLSDGAAGPVVSGSRIYLTTRKGRIVAVEAATGELAAAAQLPQGAAVAPAVRQTRLYQLGEHSTLFVLDANSLACTETVYLGHQAGEIFVPPVAVLDQLLVVESPADDFSQIRVLSPDPQTKRLAIHGRPQRLKGRIMTPLAVSGIRVAAITDLSQVAVFEVDSSGTQDRLRLIAGLDASEKTPLTTFCALKSDQLWIASRRRSLFQVQSALQQLNRLWTENHDDSFVAPLALAGDVLVQVRRRSGIPAVLVEGCGATSGKPLWTTHVAAPIAALAASESRQAVDVLTAEGRLYSLRGDAMTAGQLDKTKFSPSDSGAAIFPGARLSADGRTLVWTESPPGSRVYVYDMQTGAAPVAISLPARASANAVSLGSDLIAPLVNGSVVLLPRERSAAQVGPFLPPLVPDALPRWTQPAALADGKTFLISDGRGAVYAVARQERPQPHLAAIGESRTGDPVVSPLVLAGSTVVGVMRKESSDAIAGLDAKGASAFEPVTLEGRVEAGPFAVGGLAFVTAEPDGLVCIGSDGKARWQQPLEHGPLAGPPLALAEGDLLVVHQSGVVSRVDPATGKELASHDVGESLLGPACVLGQHAYLAGSDGTLHRVAIPPRPEPSLHHGRSNSNTMVVGDIAGGACPCAARSRGSSRSRRPAGSIDRSTAVRCGDTRQGERQQGL